MKIKKKRLNKINNVLSLIGNNDFYIKSIIVNEMAKKIGISKFEVGEKVLPTKIGPVTMFNVDGKEVIHDPKIKETISHELWYNIVDWHGNPHSGYYTREFIRWKRDFINAPNEYVIVENIDGDFVEISTRLISYNENKNNIKHLLNLILEICGEIEIVDSDKNPIIISKKVAWKIFPPGDMPWEKYSNNIKEKIKNYDSEKINAIKERYDFLQSLNPKSIICGNDGLIGYFIAEIYDDLFICDSIFIGNAIYVLNQNWKEISKLTKKEIIDNNYADKRIVHNGNWKQTVKKVIKSHK